MAKKSLFTLVAIILMVGLLVGCGGGGATAPAGGVPEDAALKITGRVENEVGWTEDEILGMDTLEAEYENKEGALETYTGVSLNALLEQAGVQDGAGMVELIADNDNSAEVDLGELSACSDCIVAFRSNGGFSTVLPGFPKNTRVKGVVEINVK